MVSRVVMVVILLFVCLSVLLQRGFGFFLEKHTQHTDPKAPVITPPPRTEQNRAVLPAQRFVGVAVAPEPDLRVHVQPMLCRPRLNEWPVEEIAVVRHKDGGLDLVWVCV